MIATDYIKEGHAKRTVLEVLGIARSSYYYRPSVEASQKGRVNSEFTYTQNGDKLSNAIVVEDIKEILFQEFVDYGYLKVTHWLRQQKGYRINPKKVYRLMRDANLLNKKGQ